ncbi:glycosyl hydrolase family 46 [Methylobacter tundripaludum]|uniref:Glycosyl hydrolase family 46 n=1 Tax=Methylobacter tundripaludum TaxID=173365 RepID=A0A2S6H8W3_9GAMM|nr:chitosanase [Methylobacter tundripaludum]PPK73905.1 glycosyl hydrolase family 46 [Methylobacter tundripaludum]
MNLTDKQKLICEQIIKVFEIGSTQGNYATISIFHDVQDASFYKSYFQPAMKWADDNGFTLPLSALVIYDSFIHSGSIPAFLRKRFDEMPPKKEGDEKTWISEYVNVRQNWLATASNPALHPTVYRTQCFNNEIARNNWDLSLLPINANGVHVSGV